MKYHIITTIFVFLFLACRPDFNIDQKDIKYPPTEKSRPKTESSKQKESKPKTEEELKKKQQEEELKKKQQEEELKKKQQEEELKKKQQLKNTLSNDLKKQIESAYNFKEKYVKSMEKEPEDHYGMTSFRGLNWGPGTEDISDNTERSIRYRRHTYTVLSPLDPHELKEFANIIQDINKLASVASIFNSFSAIGGALDIVSDHLYFKKDNLDKLDIADLEILKNSFEQILYIKGSVAGKAKKLLLDYKNLKTDINKLKSYSNELVNGIKQQALEAENLEELIVSKYKL
ncbi:CRASP family complement regulator-acquiring lipoprotein [Borreliella burgdorferi]|uniref:virulence associated lipoprotein n=1 Tax=Borreliella burgdorferi TaxID=139 RepID=UPI0027070776|nr:CRASP family complement regulator-acquiring lipoprotein [Borreliella burgdorferi]MDO7256762.1 CRASP family complement regulator-acquiring lipoprotein [Borreliella burgdorferi]